VQKEVQKELLQSLKTLDKEDLASRENLQERINELRSIHHDDYNRKIKSSKTTDELKKLLVNKMDAQIDIETALE